MTNLVRRPNPGIALWCLAALLISPVAQAQTAPPAGTTEPSVSDRVKKDAASPLYWIRLNAQKGDATAPAAKAAPRIAEIRPTPTPSKPAASAQAPAAAGNTTTTASSGAAAPSNGAVASTNEATGILAAPASLAAANPSAASLGGTVGAGMAAPSASPAAARAAAAAEAEEPLSLVKAEEPDFPIIVMRRLRKGNVQVRFDVQPNGGVANVTVVQTSARALNEAALEAVRTWQFKPVSSTRSAIVDLGFDLDS
ncbi:energy transducer TonB [Ideonella sp. YS5]|uniref:energy transducer TonB n=1 Tax=Ideonella sp. YS5 TaxID=3453714 RepID=UPI003EEFF961